MKTLLIWMLIALCPGTTLGSQKEDIAIKCVFGVPARYDVEILDYPDFSIRLVQKNEYLRDEGQEPWRALGFEVIDKQRGKTCAFFGFNSEYRANGRRFDVGGRIYVVEMYYTTKGCSMKESFRSRSHTRLKPDELIVWSEDSAKTGNPKIHGIWEREGPHPFLGCRNAYSDGTLISGFNGGAFESEQHCLRTGSLEVEKTARVDEKQSITSREPSFSRVYGSPVHFKDGILRFPDFSILFIERQENHSFNPGNLNMRHGSSVAYRFAVFDAMGKRNPSGFSFDTYSRANGRRFEVGGKSYLTEMFLTSAALPGHDANRLGAGRILPEGEVIVWNEDTARKMNPTIIEALTGKEWQAFAGGCPVYLQSCGSFSYWKPENACNFAELDKPLTVVQRTEAEYPKKLSGSGFVGHASGTLFIAQDGNVESVIAFGGNGPVFYGPCQKALALWRFSPPMKEGKPTRVVASFDWEIHESDSARSQIWLR